MIRFRKKQLVILIFAIASLFVLKRLSYILTPFLSVQSYHLQWHYHAILYSVFLSNLLTKEPLLQIVDEDTIDLVFETRHDPKLFDVADGIPSATVYWNFGSHIIDQVSTATVLDDEMEVFVYRARLHDSSIAKAAGLFYHIQIGSWSSKPYRAHLKASSQNEGPIRIGVLGDNQFAAVRFSTILRQMGYSTDQLDMMIHLGDAVQDAASARAWSTDFWYPIGRNGLLDMPWIMLRGNHDSPSIYTSTPDVGPSDIGYTSFYLSRVKVLFIILDSNTDSELQDRFLESALKTDRAQAATRRIVLVHIPPFVQYWDPIPWKAGEKLWGAFVRTKWVPLFQKYHVDLVISGHQHNYQRGRQGQVTYIIAGGAGGTLDEESVEHYDLDDPVTIIQHHFGVLELDEQAGISWKLYLKDGSLADEVVI